MSEKTKKVSYANLLKEALSDFTEIPKNVDTVGPFLDPILSYKGDGELPTHKDAASILERYYFEQDQDKGVTVALDEEESVVDKDIVTVGKDKAALPEVPEDVEDSKKDTEKAMAMEQAEEEMVADEEEETEEVEEQIVPEEPAGLAGDEKELPPTKGKDGEGQVKAAQLEADDSVESAVIEKLISEMEEEEGEEEEEMDYEQDEEEEEEEEELDVDKEMEDEVEEQAAPSAVPGGPSPKHREGEDEEDKEIYEAFSIFKEQIEDEEEVPEVNSEEVVV
jgi:hypothetical protein